MKRKLSIFMSMLLLLVISLTSVTPVLAQDSDETTTDSWLSSLDGLALIAPIWAPLDTEVSMTVLQRSDATSVSEAGIWALTREKAETLNEELAAIYQADAATLTDTDWESLVEVHGDFLGRTNDSGKLEVMFSEAGRYVLVAVKHGYIPGRTAIGVGIRARALGIEAPRSALPGEPVDINVFQRNTEDAVEDAGVWALTREEAEALQAEVEAMRAEDETAIADADWEALVSVRGIFLGRTDGDGRLECSFAGEGNYLLIAVNRGYFPGRTGIAVREVPQGLTLETWRWAQVDEEVTMNVSDRESDDPVEGAGIWALTREEAEALKEEIAAIRESGEGTLGEVDWEALVSVRGMLLGRTNGDGKLECSFSEPGGYAIVAVKSGYLPGHAFIIILPPRDQVMHAEQARIQARPANQSLIQTTFH